tara:strand:- start:1154 stop:1375 length:222 start_codon:yes stop_codon:yes gene_type:complete
MLTEEIISKERGYLDKVALVVLEAYVSNQKPKGFEDSMSLSRVAYKQALAMLEVRETSIISLAKESGLMRGTK